ncbi:MAG: hypothetical protein KJP00_12095 [Bacteroidia bacterium]|nr:hypothetical protein [Bacteroidia bacterium]
MKLTSQKATKINILPILLGFLFCLLCSVIHAQDEPVRTRISLSCTQMPESRAYLQARILARVEGRYAPQANLELSFYHSDEVTETLIGKASTNRKGIAVFQLDSIDKYSLAEDSTIIFTVLYEGSDSYAESDDEISIRRANIEVSTSSEDSEKIVSVSAYSLAENPTPIADVEIILSVPRMYSDLNIGEDYTDEDGQAEFIIPDGIPGDKEGNLELKVRIIDTDEYGDLELNFKEPWGIPKPQVVEANRELWTPNAPLWMVITFGFLMIVAWSNFGIVIRQLLKLRKLGKQEMESQPLK